MVGTLLQLSDALPVVDPISGWANLTATGAMMALLVWVVTKAFPKMLDRHDEAQLEARNHFEKILNKVEDGAAARDQLRLAATKDGHDAARKLADQIAINTQAVQRLADRPACGNSRERATA